MSMLRFLIAIVEDLDKLDKDAWLLESEGAASTVTSSSAVSVEGSNETAALAFSTLLGVTSAPHGIISVTLIVVIGAALSLLTTCGNMLVIVSFKVDKHLQTINNYFLFSLAVADLIVGCVSIPLMTVYTAAGSWPLGYEVCQLWLNVDYMMSNASVLNLLLISTDRFLSVTMPLTYRPRRTKRRAIGMIVLTFVISSLLWPPWIISWPYIEGKFISSKLCIIQFLITNPYVTLGTACAAFYVPVTIMVVLYTKVYRVTKQRGEAIKRLQGFHKRSMCFAKATNTHLHRSKDKVVTTVPLDVGTSSSESEIVALNHVDEEEEVDLVINDDDDDSVEELHLTQLANNYTVPQVKIDPPSTGKRKLKMKFLPAWRLKNRATECARRYSQPDNEKPARRALRFSQVLDLENFTQYQKSPVHDCATSNVSTLLVPSDDPNSVSTTDGSMFLKEGIYSMIAAMDNETCVIESRLGALVESQKITGGSGDLAAGGGSSSVEDTRRSSDITPGRPLLFQLLPSFLAMTVASRSVTGNKIRQKLMKMNQSINLAAKLRRSESKAAKMLSAILFAFIFTWLPYNVIVLVEAFVPLTVPPILFTLSYYLCYLNSTVNPLCYALCNRAFRRTYVRILTCKWTDRR